MNPNARLLVTGASSRGWHRLQTFLECPQKFAWTYRVNAEHNTAEKQETAPLIRGTLTHLGLAHYYARLRETQQGRDPELFLTPEDAISLYSRYKGAPYMEHAEEITACVQGYIRKYAAVDTFKVLAVEELYEARIGGYLFTGRLDLVVEDTRGGVWVFDHKTTGRIEAKQREFYTISGQLLGYRWLARQNLGARFMGLRINLIQHGNGDFKYERPQLGQAPHLYSRFEDTVITTEKAIEALDASGRAVEQWPVAMNEMTCYGRYGACPHIEKCKWGPG